MRCGGPGEAERRGEEAAGEGRVAKTWGGGRRGGKQGERQGEQVLWGPALQIWAPGCGPAGWVTGHRGDMSLGGWLAWGAAGGKGTRKGQGQASGRAALHLQ